MTAFRIQPGPLTVPFEHALGRLEQARFADALWNRRLDVWSTDPAVQQKIAHRLGWLSAIDFVAPHLPRLRALADSVRAEGVTDVVLLGMGGSSLAPEVLRRSFGVDTFHVLDTTHPRAIRSLEERLDFERTLFLVSSKSGSTIETRSHLEYFWKATDCTWDRFAAITDPQSDLERLADERGF